MASRSLNFSILQGETFRRRFKRCQADGHTPLDLTGWTFPDGKLILPPNPAVIVTVTQTLVNAAAGQWDATIPSSVTATLKVGTTYQILLEQHAANGDVRKIAAFLIVGRG
jgi:hypothetical protein